MTTTTFSVRVGRSTKSRLEKLAKNTGRRMTKRQFCDFEYFRACSLPTSGFLRRTETLTIRGRPVDRVVLPLPSPLARFCRIIARDSPPRRFPPPWIIDEHPELLGHPDEPEE